MYSVYMSTLNLLQPRSPPKTVYTIRIAFAGAPIAPAGH